MSAKHLLNVEAFALFVHMRAEHPKQLSTTQAATEAGVSRAQFFRAIKKQSVNNQAFLTLCLWMKAYPFSFLIDGETGRTLAPLPEANVSRPTSTETRGSPQSEAA